MLYTSIIFALIYVFILTAVSTAILDIIFRFFGRRGYLKNLYPNVRGGTPRAIGLIPFIVLSFYMVPDYSNLVLIMGVCAFIDDIMGRVRSRRLGMEIGQFVRGIGIISVIIVGFLDGMGISAFFIAFMIQPFNISDMQPGSTCMVTIIMSVFTIITMLIFNSAPVSELPAVYTPILILIVCMAYSPLDFAGKIMLGEVGNHTFGVSLAIAFYITGGLLGVIVLGLITVMLIAFVRRNSLRLFLTHQLRIINPTFGDYVMDVLTGGGLGDLIRKWIFKDVQYKISHPLLIMLGFRRLFYNPHAFHTKSRRGDSLLELGR